MQSRQLPVLLRPTCLQTTSPLALRNSDAGDAESQPPLSPFLQRASRRKQEAEQNEDKDSSSYGPSEAQIDSLQEKKSGKPKAIKNQKDVKKQVPVIAVKTANTNKFAR